MDNPKKILLIQLKRAGDVILTTPAAAILKRRFPQARIDFLVEKPFAPLLEQNPAIDTIHVYDKRDVWGTLRRVRSERYDLIFDFQSSPRSAIVVLTSGARRTAGYRVPFWGYAFGQTVRRPGSPLSVVEGKMTLLEAVVGLLGERPLPFVAVTQAERAWADSAMPKPKSRGLIGLVPTHRRDSRRWHAESFVALARQWCAAGFEVWLFWGPGEKDYVQQIQTQVPQAHVIPATTLRQMATLLARCELVISNDNGPMHLAAAVGIPTVTLYGPTDPHAWNHAAPQNVALQAEGVRCLRCNLNTCPFNHECMTQLTPESVFAASQKLLSRDLVSEAR